MPIDTSMYQSIQGPQQQQQAAPQSSYLDTIGKAYSVAGMANQMKTQQGMKDAYANNIDPKTGQLNQAGYLSDLGRVAPQAVPEMQKSMAEASKLQAESRTANIAAAQAKSDYMQPKLEFINTAPDAQKPALFNSVMQEAARAGINVDANVPKLSDGTYQFEPDKFQEHLMQGRQSQQWLLKNAEIAQKQNEANMAPTNLAKTQSEIEKNAAETAKTKSETIKQNPAAAGSVNDPTTDPATLVPRMVPKEHQAKALEEIKNSQDINALSPKILAAFQMGSSRNPITAAQGKKEFEGLMNTTVKEQEGTARQAAFDSIHEKMTPSGLLAAPGENDAKLRTVQEYLQSKASAPTNKAYGIDLSKFPSTSPSRGSAASNNAPVALTAAHDSAAIDWLKQNPSGPMADRVRAGLKARGVL